MKDYNYKVKDNSQLTKGFIKIFVKPLQKFLSGRLPANYITIIAHLSVYLALYFSWRQDVAGHMNFLLVSFLIFVHLLCDKLDGFHARITGTVSALGEFADHFFEILSRGALIFVVFNLYDIGHGWTVVAVVAITVFWTVVQYYRQYKTGILVKAKIGAMELKLLVILLIFMAHFIPVLTFLNDVCSLGYTAVEWLLLVLFFGITINVIRSLLNVPQISYGFWLFLALFIVVAGSATMVYDTGRAGILILLYGGLYAGRLMITQLVDGVERSPGFFTPIFLLIHYLAGYFEAGNTFIIVIIYLATNILLVIIRMLKAKKSDWHWVNPR